MSIPRLVLQVRALFREGQTVECVQNTYRPEINGTRRHITKLGKGYADCVDLDGPQAGKGFYMKFPERAADVLAVDSDSVTYRIGREDHAVTLRIVR